MRLKRIFILIILGVAISTVAFAGRTVKELNDIDPSWIDMAVW